MIAEAEKNILALTFIMVVIFLMAGCRANRSGPEAGNDMLMVKWESEMKEVFPEWTNDTAEIKRRLDYFRQTGNKLGQQAMLRQMGNTERFSSRFRSAVEYHSMALQLAYDINDTVLITTSLNELGTDFRRIGTYEEAIEYHYKSLQLSEAYKGNDTVSITRNIASSYNGIGIIYSAMNQPEEAINAYQKALKIEVGKSNLKGMAMNHANIGSVYFNLGDYEKAEEFFNKSLDNNVEAELQMGIALCNINIGRVMKQRERMKKR